MAVTILDLVVKSALRLVAHQQVEIALPVTELGILEPVERVGQRAADLGQQHELVDGQRGLPAPRLHRLPRGADDVAEVDVDLARPFGRAEQLDPARAVDEVEEDELPHVAPGHHTAGDAQRLVGVLARFERLGGRAHGGDVVPVMKALGQAAHGGESRGTLRRTRPVRPSCPRRRPRHARLPRRATAGRGPARSSRPPRRFPDRFATRSRRSGS